MVMSLDAPATARARDRSAAPLVAPEAALPLPRANQTRQGAAVCTAEKAEAAWRSHVGNTEPRTFAAVLREPQGERDHVRAGLLDSYRLLTRGLNLGEQAAAVAAPASASIALLVDLLDSVGLNAVRTRALQARAACLAGTYGPADLRADLASVASWEQDTFALRFFDIDRAPVVWQASKGGHGYVPSNVSTILSVLDEIPPHATLVDHGCGAGLVLMMHAFLNGGRAVGVELQAGLADVARAAAGSLGLDKLEVITGSAAEHIPVGDVHYLYNPFGEKVWAPIVAALSARAADPSRRLPIYLGGTFGGQNRPAGFTYWKPSLYVAPLPETKGSAAHSPRG